MKRLALVLGLALALPATAQGWAKASQGWGKISSSGGGATGLTYNSTTDTVTSTGTIVAKNITASGLATPGAITVTPKLTQVGSITTVAGSALVDGDYFTIKYDGGTIPVEFDLSPGDGTTGGRIPLLFTAGDSANTVRDNVILTLNAAAPTKITASSGGAATVALVLDTPGADASATPNTENVTDGTFAVTGFANPTAATTVTYKLVALMADGATTEAGAASSTAAATATLSAANFLRLTWSAVTGAASYRVYRTVAPTTPATTGIVYAGTALTVDDTGLAGGGETAPTGNGTGILTGKLAAPSGCSASSVPIFLGSPVAMGCDAGLTYDAGADALTVGTVKGTVGVEAGAYMFSAGNVGTYVGGYYWYAGNTGHFLGADHVIAWNATAGNAASAAGNDSGLRRVSPGLVGVTDGSTGNGALQTGGVQYVTGSRPTCDAAARGMTWYVAGGAGAADTIEVCGKAAADTYSWVALATF